MDSGRLFQKYSYSNRRYWILVDYSKNIVIVVEDVIREYMIVNSLIIQGDSSGGLKYYSNDRE